MKVSCPSCQTNYNIDDRRIPPGGAKLKCARCQTTFPIKLEAASAAESMPQAPSHEPAIPLPGFAAPQASAAIPLPGAAAPQQAISLGAGPGAAIPLPGSAAPQASAAIPLPGAAAPQQAISLGAGPSAAIPLPGAAPQAISLGAGPGAAIPLPGSAAPQAISLGTGPGAAIPLPGAAAATIPLPGTAAPRAAIPLPAAPPQDDPFAFDPSTGSADAIPLPGSAAPADPYAAYDEGPLDGYQDRDSTRVVAIPMPTDAYRDPSAPFGVDGSQGTARDFDFSDSAMSDVDVAEPEAPQEFDFSDAQLPPPPAPDRPDPFALDLENAPDASAEALPVDDPFALPPPPQDSAAPALEEDPFALPPPPQGYAPPALEEDPFALPPPPQGYAPAAMEEDPFALPPPPAATPDFDFADLPAPVEPGGYAPPAAQGMDFSDLPSPVAPAPAVSTLDFSDLPSPVEAPPSVSFDFADSPTSAPAPDFQLDFSEPPAAAPAPAADPFAMDFSAPPPASVNPTTDFGDVDFGEPPPVAGASDSLEFDPTASAPLDDLEADLSAPLPPPPAAGPTDGLEMLSFIDDAAPRNAGASAAKVTRFHVRRRSGKVFGPFDEGVIVKMLEDGQLLGNEDVSLDSETWSAIGTNPTFGSAIERLMAGPSKAVVPAVGPASGTSDAPAGEPGGSQASMDRLRQLYEGRMAAVSVVDRSAATEQWKKRIPMMVGAGVAVLVLGTGLSFEFTRYGAFGRNKLLPARVSKGSAEAKLVDEARAELLQDTFASYKLAHDQSAKVLASKEYPEVRALWCQAVNYLQRHYAAGDPAEMQRCQQAVEHVELLGEKNLEFIKMTAGMALTARQPDAVLPSLRDAYSREGNQADLELSFLLAEAHATKKDAKSAIETLKKVLEKDPKSAKALHALGNLYQASGDADEAAKAYDAALAADSKHAASAVELAAVELLVRKSDVEKGAKAVDSALALQAELGPAERARARGLKGVALFQQFKPKEAETELKAALQENPTSDFIKAQLARVLRAQRDYDGALPLYQDLAGDESGNLEYVDGHITSLVMTGKMQDALTAVEAASKNFPNEARIAYLYGRIEDALDQPAEAEGHFKRATAADAKLVDASLYLGRLYLRQHRNADARTLLEASAAQAADHAGVHAGLGELALAENNALLARQEFDRAVQLDPNLADAHLGLSRVAMLNGDLPRAESEANRALELDPHLLKDGRLQRGLVLWRLHKLDEAIAELEKAKAEDPRSTNIPITLGAVLLEKGDLASAESNLGLALRNEPSNHEALYYQGLVKAKRSEFTQALDNMKSAVERAPKRPDYRYAYGVILRDAKNLPDAIEQWKIAVDLDAKNADAHEALGHAYLERGEFDSAIESFELSLKADAQRIRVMGAIGDALFSAARWDEAIKRYQAALKADPQLTYVYYKIARAFTEQAQHAKAIDWYRKATAAEPQNPMPYYYLGFAYKEKNKRRDAIAAFKEYLSRKPEATDRKDIEDEIYDLEH
ncbi:hypothetical protein DRW03_26550 [Corallococcus sp. H22C18031201]|nr:hypothetical protein DRW03_26550 [Corallococcus sp. H22C18031201]